MGLKHNSAKQPAGFYSGEVASMGKNFHLLQPREEEQQRMHELGDAGCSNRPLQSSDVAEDYMCTPCMANCPNDHQSPHVQTMQQEQVITPAPLSDPIPSDTNQTNGSLIGPSLILTHTTGPRPEPHTNTSKQPTSLSHTPLEQPLPYSPSLRAGDGESRKIGADCL